MLQPSPERRPDQSEGLNFSLVRMSGDCVEINRSNFSYLHYVLNSRRGGWREDLVTGAFILALSAYGAAHVISDLVGFSFPSRIEHLFWRISCYFITGVCTWRFSDSYFTIPILILRTLSVGKQEQQSNRTPLQYNEFVACIGNHSGSSGSAIISDGRVVHFVTKGEG